MIHAGRTLGHEVVPALVLSLAVIAATALPATVYARTRAAIPPQAAGAGNGWRDVVRELAARLSASIARAEAFDLRVADALSPAAPAAPALQRELLSLLRGRGLRPVPRTDTTTHVVVTCAENLKDHLCAAELSRPGGRTILVASRPLTPSADAEPRPLVGLTVRPLLAHRQPILDLAVLDERRLLVLDTGGLVLLERKDEGWSPRDRQAIDIGGPWPRDPRGRLVVKENLVEAFVSGRECKGTADPLSIACTQARSPWPLGVDNAGLTEGRNFFTSARTGPFFSAAPLAASNATSWLVAGIDGRLVVLDPAAEAVEEVQGRATDVAALGGACSADAHFVLVGSEAEDSDGLRLYQLAGRRLLPIAPPVVLPGPLAALWPTGDPAAVLAVSQNLVTDRYEAFLVGVACVR